MGELAGTAPWWVWPLALFVTCFLLGIVAVPAGIGGAVLFVPIVSGFFPFHLDYIRGAGLLVALAGAIAAAPRLLESGLANLRLGLPLALSGSVGSVMGAMLGLALPAATVQVALGLAILAIVAVMASARNSGVPDVPRGDVLSEALRIHGVFRDAATGRDIEWRVHRTPAGIAVFAGIGMLAGLFGLGAGWANVPALNMLMGAPLKLSAGTSGLILSLVDSAAAWVYLHEGAVLAMIAAPSVAGVMLGGHLGVGVLRRAPAVAIRRLVLALMVFAGVRSLLKGLGIWN